MGDRIYCNKRDEAGRMRCVKPQGHPDPCHFDVHVGSGPLEPDGGYSFRDDGPRDLATIHNVIAARRIETTAPEVAAPGGGRCLMADGNRYDRWCYKGRDHEGACEFVSPCGAAAEVDGRRRSCDLPNGHPGDHRYDSYAQGDRTSAVLEADPLAALTLIKLEGIDHRTIHTVAHVCSVRDCRCRLILTIVDRSPPTFTAADAAAVALGWEIKEPKIVDGTMVAGGYKLCPTHTNAGRRC